jgi:hypothetical protein
MTTTLDCPNCGAPLELDLKAGDTTVECSFCHDTVIIPEEIRIPLPPVVVYRQPPPRQTTRSTWVVIGIIVACVFSAGIFSFLSTSSSDTRSSALDTSSDTVPTKVVIDTQATAEAKATATALQPLLKQEQAWPAVLTEKFGDNSNGWQNGDVRDSYVTGTRSINDGLYTWKITAVKSVSDYSFPTMPDQTDFFASVDLTMLQMPDDVDADAGMVFRYNSTDQSWYYFSINEKGVYYLGWYNGTDWSTLIPQTFSPAIQPGKKNHLSVGAQGSQFIFLINDQMVDHFNNDYQKSGGIGVGLSLTEAGEKAIIQFANFTVLSPPPAP